MYDPTLAESDARELGAKRVDLDDLMSQSDVVTVHAPVLPSTIGMIGEHELALMTAGSTLINTARGSLIDHEALRRELVSGRLSAVLDVTEPEPLPVNENVLYTLPNVILTPHIAGSMGNELTRLGDAAVDEVVRFAEGLPLRYAITLHDLASMA